MSRILSLFVVLTLLLAAIPLGSTAAQADDPPPLPVAQCIANGGTPITFGLDPAKPFELNGSYTCVWFPPPAKWTGDLVIFAHGYVDPADELGLPLDQLALTTPSLPELVVGMGYAFAVPTYSKNGLAVLEGVRAVKELATFIKTSPLGVKNIYLVGASEGGLVTALAIEQNSDKTFKGGVTTCGPIGDFKQQANYWGDFRVLFDYYFPGLGAELNNRPPLEGTLPGSPVNIPESTSLLWGKMVIPTASGFPPGYFETLQGEVTASLAANPEGATDQLMKVSKAPFDATSALTKAATIDLTVRGLLDYNIKATNEARNELAGTAAPVDLFSNAFQPFDNAKKFYFGLTFAQNKLVERFTADPMAIAVMQPYQTTGRIKAPLVALHTTGDPIVPYWHEPLYLFKVWMAGKGSQFLSIPVVRYGHCAFTAKEALFAFAVVVFKATGKLPLALLSLQTDPQPVLTLEEYNQMMMQYGPKVYIPMTQK